MNIMINIGKEKKKTTTKGSRDFEQKTKRKKDKEDQFETGTKTTTGQTV